VSVAPDPLDHVLTKETVMRDIDRVLDGSLRHPGKPMHPISRAELVRLRLQLQAVERG
jgi:hypothetical protein